MHLTVIMYFCRVSLTNVDELLLNVILSVDSLTVGIVESV